MTTIGTSGASSSHKRSRAEEEPDESKRFRVQDQSHQPQGQGQKRQLDVEGAKFWPDREICQFSKELYGDLD